MLLNWISTDQDWTDCSGKLLASSAETRLPLASWDTYSSLPSHAALSSYKENPMTRLFPVSSQVLKLWSGGGYHDVPESLLHGSPRGDEGPRGNEERVSCAWSCGAMRGLPHGLLANLGIFYLFVSQRFGSTACVLIWKVWCQPKLKAYCSRRLRALSRWWTKRLDQLKQADIRRSGRVYLPRCKEQKHQTLTSKIR